MPSRVLIIEDDPDIARLLQLDLQDHGYEVEHVDSAMAGLVLAREAMPDLILLDLGLPDFDGSDVITRLRKTSLVPIIAVTARDSVEEKVRVLTLGADDYVVKPFNVTELLARIKVQLREKGSIAVECGDLVLHPDRRQVRYKNAELQLTPKEFEILWLLAREPGKVFRREELTAQVWGGHLPEGSNVIDVHMSNIRNKLRDVNGYGAVRTVRGYGYALKG